METTMKMNDMIASLSNVLGLAPKENLAEKLQRKGFDRWLEINRYDAGDLKKWLDDAKYDYETASETGPIAVSAFELGYQPSELKMLIDRNNEDYTSVNHWPFSHWREDKNIYIFKTMFGSKWLKEKEYCWFEPSLLSIRGFEKEVNEIISSSSKLKELSEESYVTSYVMTWLSNVILFMSVFMTDENLKKSLKELKKFIEERYETLSRIRKEHPRNNVNRFYSSRDTDVEGQKFSRATISKLQELNLFKLLAEDVNSFVPKNSRLTPMKPGEIREVDCSDTPSGSWLEKISRLSTWRNDFLTQLVLFIYKNQREEFVRYSMKTLREGDMVEDIETSNNWFTVSQKLGKRVYQKAELPKNKKTEQLSLF